MNALVYVAFFILCYFIFSLMNALVYVDIDQGIHQGKNKVAQNEKRKNYLGFLMSKVWQILQHFTGTFHRAQTLKLWGVISLGSYFFFAKCLHIQKCEFQLHALLLVTNARKKKSHTEKFAQPRFLCTSIKISADWKWKFCTIKYMCMITSNHFDFILLVRQTGANMFVGSWVSGPKLWNLTYENIT